MTVEQRVEIIEKIKSLFNKTINKLKGKMESDEKEVKANGWQWAIKWSVIERLAANENLISSISAHLNGIVDAMKRHTADEVLNSIDEDIDRVVRDLCETRYISEEVRNADVQLLKALKGFRYNINIMLKSVK